MTTAYSVAPCAIIVPPESPVRRPEDLAGVPVGVGLSLRQPLRHAAGAGGRAPAGADHAHLPGSAQRAAGRAAGPAGPGGHDVGVPLYIAEAFGFRKVLDATFMIGFLVTGRTSARPTSTSTWPRCGGHRWRSTCTRSGTSTTTCGPCRRSTATRSTCAPSAPANASSSCPTPGRSSPRPGTGRRRARLFPGSRPAVGYDEAALV